MSIIEKTNYYDKYLKYKSKYNELKSQMGGGWEAGEKYKIINFIFCPIQFFYTFTLFYLFIKIDKYYYYYYYYNYY